MKSYSHSPTIGLLTCLLTWAIAAGVAGVAGAAEGGPRNWSNTPPWPQRPDGPQHKTFRSELVKTDIGYTVWLPSEYNANPDARFPTIYSLHGIGGNEVDGAMPFSRDLRRAIDAGKCPPAILIMVNGYRDSFYVDSFDKSVPMESIIIRELIPHIDATYRTIAHRGGRGIVGFSMGGYGAMRLGLAHYEIFGCIVSLAGAFIGEDTARARGQAAFGGDMEYFRTCDPTTIARANAEKVRGRMRILIACGDRDNLLPRNRQLVALLSSLKIEHTFVTVPEVGHDLLQMYGALEGRTWQFFGEAFRPPPDAAP